MPKIDGWECEEVDGQRRASDPDVTLTIERESLVLVDHLREQMEAGGYYEIPLSVIRWLMRSASD